MAYIDLVNLFIYPFLSSNCSSGLLGGLWELDTNRYLLYNG